ncbi:MAG: HAMP domain-containing sensor histidine kinase [Candidatus Paceibacterota bacterium]|jgi:signal transduction histidine kinase
MHQLYRTFFNLLIKPLQENEDDRRHEFILNTILVVSIIFISILDFRILVDAYIYKEKYHGVPVLWFSMLLFLFVSLLFASRKGFSKLSSFGILTLYTFGTTYTAWMWGFDVPSVILGYVLIIAISSILISVRFSLVVAIILSISIVTIGYYQISIKKPIHEWRDSSPDIEDTFEYALVLGIITFLYWLSNREIEKGLIRARISEKELIQERDNLKDALKEITILYRFAEFGKVSAGAFHDLINPLTSINLIINELNQNINPQIPEVHEYLERAVSASRRMQNFIDALRKQLCSDTHQSSFDPKKEIDEAILFLSYKIKKSKCEIKKDYKEDEFELFGNPLAFYQIITNLISNAVDACEEMPNGKRSIEISMQPRKIDFVIKIKDSGHGIKPELLSHIFEPFFTTKSSGSEIGLGLGLSTVKRIIEKEFKGAISVSNNNNLGALFTIIIPTKKHGQNIEGNTKMYRHHRKRTKPIRRF